MRMDVSDPLGERGCAKRPGLKAAIGKGLAQPCGGYPGGPWPEPAAPRGSALLSAGAIASPGHAGDGAGMMRPRGFAANARGNASLPRLERATARARDDSA